MLIQGQVGPTSSQSASPGTNPTVRMGQLGDVIVSELHGRFYEQAYRGTLFSGGMTTLTTIAASTFTTATTSATATPIVGLWNPMTSSVNCVLLQANLNTILTALQATGTGGFVWMVSLNNNAITTGRDPLNRRTLQTFGSQARDMSGLALTGMSGTLVPRFGSALGGGHAYNTALLSTAAGLATTMQPSVENFDGSIIIPPGGVIGLFATTTPVAHSCVSGLLWEEVPL